MARLKDPENQACAELCQEIFAKLGALRVKAMFGGAGIYADEVFFVLIADGEIYLKADAALAERLAAAGSRQFVWTNPSDGKQMAMSYWRLPESALDDLDEAEQWGRAALAVAQQAALKKAVKKKRG